MIDFLRTWANQIIVAVIIATIIEMILPNGKNKKYIKMIIGIYVLFTIIQPIITKVTGNTLEISNFNYKKYFDEDILETSTEEFEDNNSKLIEQAYIDNIKNDIKTKLKQKGYEAVNLSIDIINNQNKASYGTIESIILSLKKTEGNKQPQKENENIISVAEVNINVNTNKVEKNTEENSNLSDKEMIKIIEYLSDEYQIPKENIVIN